MSGNFRFEHEQQRESAGTGPVVAFEVQENRDYDPEDGFRAWAVVHGEMQTIEEARIVHDGFLAMQRGPVDRRPQLRIAKITTEVVE